MMRSMQIAAVAGVVGLASLSVTAGAQAGPASARSDVVQRIVQNGIPAHFARDRRWGGHGWRGRRVHGYRGRGSGAAIGAGVAGLAAGALLGSALAAQAAPGEAYLQASDPDRIAYCSTKYRSFDATDGTYLGYDGQRHVCE